MAPDLETKVDLTTSTMPSDEGKISDLTADDGIKVHLDSASGFTKSDAVRVLLNVPPFERVLGLTKDFLKFSFDKVKNKIEEDKKKRRIALREREDAINKRIQLQKEEEAAMTEEERAAKEKARRETFGYKIQKHFKPEMD